ADRNRSHWSTSKTPSYTKSVSWQHHPRFPVDVLKARLKRDPLLALELVNPELDLVRQLALNGKTRAIREQAMRKLDELY
ncbi:DUF2773 domain-containing protein, partial [Escherichia coli]|uniref:DUF2773 domain-containing protein n=1 Tax=Escherichia coli TaxID=562 RepID=UPI001FCE5894